VKVVDGTKLDMVRGDGVILDGALLASFFAYDAGFAGGVHVAAGNFDADEQREVVTGAGPGAGPHVRTFDIAGGVATQMPGALASFYACDAGFAGGITVATGNFDGVAGDEVITGAMAGAGPHVRVFRSDGAILASFYAFSSTFAGGVSVAAGDVDGDGA